MAPKIAITGANGHLGQRLIEKLGPEHVVALVRSARAAASLGHWNGLDVRTVDYADANSLGDAMCGVDVLVHLVGIIKESAANSFETAHIASSQAVVEAMDEAKVKRLVYLSLVGASVQSSNPCFQSRGRAEAILAGAGESRLLLRIPMVLGEGDYASFSLSRQAQRAVNFVFRAASLEQPIYGGDVIDALMSGVNGNGEGVLSLAGPESLSRKHLITAKRFRARK